jgi:hypothetical protein
VLARLWGNGFTSGDEGFTATARFRFGSVWDAAIAMATGHGRFYHLFVYPAAQLPYLFDSLVVVNIFRIVTSGVTLVAFFGFVRELFGTRTAFMSGFLFLGLFDTVGGSYNPFHGLPLWFNTGMSLLLFSFWIYARNLRLGMPLHAAYLLFFAALLTYEPMLLYAPAYVVMYFAARDGRPNDSSQYERLLEFLRNNIGLLGAVSGYLALYAGFKVLHPGSYEGTKGLTLAPWVEIARTIWAFSINGIFLRIGTSHFGSLAWWPLIYAAVVVFGLIAASKAFPIGPGHLQKHVGVAVVCILFFVFAPNVLFAFTERYRTWVIRDPYYLGSYYSSFAICLALALLVSRLQVFRSRYLRAGTLGLMLTVFSLLAYGNQVQSMNFYSRSRRDAIRWPAADALADTIRNQNWNAQQICTTSFITAADPYDYWSYYLSHRIGYAVEIVFLENTPDACDLFLYFERNSREAVLRAEQNIKAEQPQSADKSTIVFRKSY